MIQQVSVVDALEWDADEWRTTSGYQLAAELPKALNADERQPIS